MVAISDPSWHDRTPVQSQLWLWYQGAKPYHNVLWFGFDVADANLCIELDVLLIFQNYLVADLVRVFVGSRKLFCQHFATLANGGAKTLGEITRFNLADHVVQNILPRITGYFRVNSRIGENFYAALEQ